MKLPQAVRPHIRGEGDQGFWPRKGSLKGFDEIDGGEPKRFEETFHPNFLFTDARKKFNIIFRPLRRRIEADMECFVPIRNRFANGLENSLYPPEGYFFSASDGLQR